MYLLLALLGACALGVGVLGWLKSLKPLAPPSADALGLPRPGPAVCPLCGQSDWIVIERQRNGVAVERWLQCRRCSSSYVRELPSPVDRSPDQSPIDRSPLDPTDRRLPFER